MILRHKVLIGTIGSLMLATFPVAAASEGTAFQACADAMMLEMSQPAATPEFRVVNMAPSSRRLARRETIHMDARGAKSGNVVARFDCTVNARAEVIELAPLPLKADDAKDRALSQY